MTRIAVQDAGTLSDVIDRVTGGEGLILTRDGEAVAEVTPVTPVPPEVRPRRRRMVPTAELREAMARLPRVDYAQMRAEDEALFGEDRV